MEGYEEQHFKIEIERRRGGEEEEEEEEKEEEEEVGGEGGEEEEEPAFSEIIVLAISVSQRHRTRFICRVYCR